MLKNIYVGIDIHSKEHKVAILSKALLEQPGTAWKSVKPLCICNNADDFKRLDSAIKTYVSSAEQVIIAVDQTSYYSEPIVSYLQAKGYDVYFLETRAMKAARERLLDEENKSDKIDCSIAAYILYLRDLHGISFRIFQEKLDLESNAFMINSIVMQRWQLNKLINQNINRLHQLLVAVFPEGESKYFSKLLKILIDYPTPKDIISAKGLRKYGLYKKDIDSIKILAESTVGVRGDLYGELIKDLAIQINETKKKLDILTNRLKEQISVHPYGKIFLSFPYLGDIAAATIIGIIKDADRWPNKKKFKKALGVYARTSQSGNGIGHSKQGKEGNRRGRRVLFQICLGCITRNARDNDFRDYYQRQRVKGKPGIKALVSTMGKLAEIIYHCLKNNELYQYRGIYK